MAISIVDYELPYDTHNEYDVSFYSDRIHTMVTSSPAMVESWLSTVTLANPNHRIVGLDVEWRPNFSRNIDNPIATLQLCTGPNYTGSLQIPASTVLPGVCLDPNCLVFQILHSESIPQALSNFLANPAFKFVGVGIESDCEKLLLDYGLRVANTVDLRGFAVDRLGVPELRNAGLKRLASAVLGKELEKPKRVTMSRWDSQWLTYAQIQYAAVDAFISYEIARQLNLRGLYSHSILSGILGDGIFTVDGKRLVNQRKVSSYELSTKEMRDFSSAVFKTNAIKLGGIISEAATCYQALEIQDLFMKATLDSVVKVLLGIELDTVHGTNEEGTRFSNAFDVANEMSMYRYVGFSRKIKRFLNIGSEAVLRKNVKVVDQFVYNLINTKTEAVHNPVQFKKGDIISRLLESREADPKYLRDLILSLSLLPVKTTASTLKLFIYMICKHPHIQENIAQEVREATNLKADQIIDEFAASRIEEALDKMHYLLAALTETLKLYPP